MCYTNTKLNQPRMKLLNFTVIVYYVGLIVYKRSFNEKWIEYRQITTLMENYDNTPRYQQCIG